MNKLISLISLLIAVYFLSSCAATSPREKLLIGTWKTHKVSPYIPNSAGGNAITGFKPTNKVSGSAQKTDTTKATSAEDARKAALTQRFIQTSERTTMKLNANKSCEIQIAGKTLTSSWKLTKKGTILVVKAPQSGEKKSLEILSINDTIAMAIEHTKFGDMITRFRKVK